MTAPAAPSTASVPAPESPRGSLSRVARLATISAIARAPGFLIPLVVASLFGAGSDTDAYFLAYGAFLFGGGMVGPALEQSIVPFVAEALFGDGPAIGAIMRSWIRRALLWALCSAALIGLLLIVGMLVHPVAGVRIQRVLTFYGLVAPAVAAWCVSGVYSGALAASWKLETSAVATGFRGMGALVGAGAAAFVHSLIPVLLGLAAGECLRLLWLRSRWHANMRELRADGHAHPAHGLLSDQSATLHRRTSVQLIASQAVNGSSPFIERFLVGSIAVAALSHVEYAARLVGVAAVLFDGGVAPWLLTRWSTLRARGMLDRSWRNIYRPIAFASALAFVVAVFIVLEAPLIVRLTLHHGAFTTQDAQTVTWLLRFYGAAYFLSMSAAAIERLILARSQAGSFLGLQVVRMSVRIGAVVTLLGPLSYIGLPVGQMIADSLHIMLLLGIAHRSGRVDIGIEQPLPVEPAPSAVV